MRIGMLTYATTQGLGRMGKQFYDSGLIDEVMVFRHPSRPSHMEWYPDGTRELVQRPFSGPVLDEWLAKINVCLFFETPFDWAFLKYCNDRGVKTALIPMYEWTPVRWQYKPNLLICPSLLDLDYFPEGVFIPVPVETKYWQERTVANRFLHNAGNVGCQEHKGTRQLLEAVQHVKSTDFRLTVRAQDARALRSIVKANQQVQRDSRVTIEYGEIPYEQLWSGHDVLIAPEKLNGLSLPLQEAYAAGMLVITTDRYPHNTWLPKEPLIPVQRYTRSRQSTGCHEFDLAHVDPKDIAAMIDTWVGADIRSYSLMGQQWGMDNSWSVLASKYCQAFEKLVGE